MRIDSSAEQSSNINYFKKKHRLVYYIHFISLMIIYNPGENVDKDYELQK
jgi:hypothetical protein